MTIAEVDKIQSIIISDKLRNKKESEERNSERLLNVREALLKAIETHGTLTAEIRKEISEKFKVPYKKVYK